MDEELYNQIREASREQMAEKTLDEIVTTKNIFMHLSKMTRAQIKGLLEDLIVIEKHKVNQMTRRAIDAEFIRIIQRGFFNA